MSRFTMVRRRQHVVAKKMYKVRYLESGTEKEVGILSSSISEAKEIVAARKGVTAIIKAKRV